MEQVKTARKKLGLVMPNEVWDILIQYKGELEADLGVELPMTKVVEKIIRDHKKNRGIVSNS